MLDSHLLQLIDKLFPFNNYYDNQKLAILKIVKSYLAGKKFFILESPPGSGKSVIGVTAAKVISAIEGFAKTYGPDTIVLTKTKSLQTQYYEFPPKIPMLTSAANYECNLFPNIEDTYYNNGECIKAICPVLDRCNYRVKKGEFVGSDVGVLNYAYFFTTKEFNPKIVIYDEAHSLESTICEFNSFALREDEIERIVIYLAKADIPSEMDVDSIESRLKTLINVLDNLDFELGKQLAVSIYMDLAQILAYVNIHVNQLEAIIIENSGSADVVNYKESYKRAKRAANFINGHVSRLKAFSVSTCDWVKVIPKSDTLTIKPLYAEEFSSKIFSRPLFNILMSGTICGISEFLTSLNISPDEADYLCLDSSYKAENRPFMNLNLPGLNKSNKDELLPLYVSTIDNIIEQLHTNYGSLRGIIHTISYDNAEFIKSLSKYRSIMYVPERGSSLNLKNVLMEADNTVLVSPSILEGMDLKDDLSRFQIFLKVPFAYIGDPWVRRRMDLSKDWYARDAIVKVIQGYGRSIRSRDDFAFTFMLDQNFSSLISRNQEKIPKWFSDAVK